MCVPCLSVSTVFVGTNGYVCQEPHVEAPSQQNLLTKESASRGINRSAALHLSVAVSIDVISQCPPGCLCAAFAALSVSPNGINATTVGIAPNRTWIIAVAATRRNDPDTRWARSCSEHRAVMHPCA